MFGWQKPCYLLVGEGYVKTYRELMEETEWERYGTGRNPKCNDCMVHCGYEATAVNDAFRSPLKALRVMLAGPRTDGDMAPEPEIVYREGPVPRPHLVGKGSGTVATIAAPVSRHRKASG